MFHYIHFSVFIILHNMHVTCLLFNYLNISIKFVILAIRDRMSCTSQRLTWSV